MKREFILGPVGVTIPANTTTAAFIMTGRYGPTTGLKEARSRGEMRLALGTPEAQPALQFANAWDGTGATVAVGTNITANGTSPPAATVTDIKTLASQYLLVREGWLVKNTHATNSASAWLDGTVDAWGD